MFGKFLSDVTKIVTVPIDITESVADVMIGGDGSKESKKDNMNIMSDVRDAACEALEDLDD